MTALSYGSTQPGMRHDESVRRKLEKGRSKEHARDDFSRLLVERFLQHTTAANGRPGVSGTQEPTASRMLDALLRELSEHPRSQPLESAQVHASSGAVLAEEI